MIFRRGQTGSNDQLKLAGLYRGLDAFLCCPGPSLRGACQADMAVPGAIVVAMNTAYPKICPDLFIGMDSPECYDSTLLGQPFPKVFGSRFVNDLYDGRPLAEYPATWFLSGTPMESVFDYFTRDTDTDNHVWNGTTMETALHMLIGMGIKTIYLVGCDMGGSKDYYDSRVLSDGQRQYNRSLYQKQVGAIRCIAETGAPRGVEIISCTEDSPLNKFLLYMPIEAAATRASMYAPKDRAVRLHGEDAENARWSGPVLPGYGVAVPVDFHNEGDLQAWWNAYKDAGNDYRVAFLDLGMTQMPREWCTAHGKLVDCTGLRKYPESLRLTACHLRSPWDTTVLVHTCDSGLLAHAFRGIPGNQWYLYHHGDESIRETVLGLMLDFAAQPVAPIPEAKITEPVAPRGVICMTTESQEWLLPWWYENFHRHNPDLPVAFFDLGMSETARQWCREHSTLIELDRAAVTEDAWFYKPAACLLSPFSHTIYMDLDCEVLASLDPLYGLCGDGFGVTPDRFDPYSKRKPPYSAGLLVFKAHDPLLMAWVTELTSKVYRHDQTALNEVLSPDKVTLLGEEWNWLRLAGPAPEGAKVLHWTGPDGKAIIREKMGHAI